MHNDAMRSAPLRPVTKVLGTKYLDDLVSRKYLLNLRNSQKFGAKLEELHKKLKLIHIPISSMGCEISRLASSSTQDSMHRPPPPSDPRSPLTSKQQYCMLASWKGVARAFEHTGIVLFVKLFEENEELLHLFEHFSELHTLATSKELADHACKVMHTLDEGIKALVDIDEFLAFTRHIGATHRRIEGFKADYFWYVEQTRQHLLRGTPKGGGQWPPSKDAKF